LRRRRSRVAAEEGGVIPSRSVQAAVQVLPLKERFSIANQHYDALDVLHVRWSEGGAVGRGEAAGVDYRGDLPQGALTRIERLATADLAQCGRERLQSMLPAGGARNALDCALWDLELRLSRRSVWEHLQLEPRPLPTVATIGLNPPDAMARAAAALGHFGLLKVKLDAHQPIERVQAVRAARPDARLVVDVNGGWTVDQLRHAAPVLVALGVELIEQPLPPACDAQLVGFRCPLPIAADESLQTEDDLPRVAEAFDVANIKLDKCGGLTAALALSERCRALGLRTMVGNMIGTSLAMAPAFVVAQWADHVDLDGPLVLQQDVPHGLVFRDGVVQVPDPRLWGGGGAA
jgi:L-Ala-D/L-Glu epimerase